MGFIQMTTPKGPEWAREKAAYLLEAIPPENLDEHDRNIFIENTAVMLLSAYQRGLEDAANFCADHYWDSETSKKHGEFLSKEIRALGGKK